MKLVISTLAVACGLAIGAEARTPQATKPAPQTKLAWPPAVEAAFKKTYPNATVKAVSKEVEDGKTIFEGAAVKEVVLTPDGTWVTPKLGK
jgi:hypothetical protein